MNQPTPPDYAAIVRKLNRRIVWPSSWWRVGPLQTTQWENIYGAFSLVIYTKSRYGVFPGGKCPCVRTHTQLGVSERRRAHYADDRGHKWKFINGKLQRWVMAGCEWCNETGRIIADYHGRIPAHPASGARPQDMANGRREAVEAEIRYRETRNEAAEAAGEYGVMVEMLRSD